MKNFAFAKSSHDEQEMTLVLDRTTEKCRICSTWPVWTRKLLKRLGEPTKTTTRDGKITSAFWEVKNSQILIQKVPKARTVASAHLYRKKPVAPRCPEGQTGDKQGDGRG